MEHAYVDELPSDEESCYYAEHLVFHPDPDPAVPPAYTDDELAGGGGGTAPPPYASCPQSPLPPFNSTGPPGTV